MVEIKINSIIDKLIIVTAKEDSLIEVEQRVQNALKTVIASAQENQVSNSDKSSQQCDENSHLHSHE